MRFLIAFMLIAFSVSSAMAQPWSQFVPASSPRTANPYKRLRYTIDTINYEGYRFARRRSSREDLNKYLYKRDATATYQLIDLQDALDRKDATEAYRNIAKIREMAGGFDLSLYQAEAEVYDKVEEAKKQYDDSMAFVKRQQEEKATRAEKEARARQEDSLASLRKEEQPKRGNYPEGLDSAGFIKEYGSRMEYNFLSSLKYKSRSGCEVVFIGSKVTWISELVKYVAAIQRCALDEDIKEGKGWAKIRLECDKGDLVIHQLYDPKTDRITSITISGNMDDLIKLFLGYWDSPMSAKGLAIGVPVYKDCINDRITISTKNGITQIRITKNPKPTMSWPLK